MIRRSFRFGLVVGLVAGAAVAMAKLFGVRPDGALPADDGAPEPWPSLTPEPTPPAAPVQVPAWTPTHAAQPAAEPTAPTPTAWAPDPSPAAAAPPAAWAPAPSPAAAAPPAPAPVSSAPLEPPTPAPPAAAPAKKAPARKAPVKAWVEPTGTVCPTSHPVKAKLTSKIFHLPGMLNYERTHPDRCYLNAAKAEADGLRPAKR